jgi:hypothetical protein
LTSLAVPHWTEDHGPFQGKGPEPALKSQVELILASHSGVLHLTPGADGKITLEIQSFVSRNPLPSMFPEGRRPAAALFEYVMLRWR